MRTYLVQILHICSCEYIHTCVYTCDYIREKRGIFDCENAENSQKYTLLFVNTLPYSICVARNLQYI